MSHHPIDVAVGQRVRDRRRGMGLSQGDLARALGITFQQVQKYERGANRVSCSRLVAIAETLSVSAGQLIGEDCWVGAETSALLDVDGAGELLRLYALISPEAQASILSVAKAMATDKALRGALKRQAA